MYQKVTNSRCVPGVSQKFPLNPGLQIQATDVTLVAKHVPPLRHGLEVALHDTVVAVKDM